MSSQRGLALVTGATSGIGAAFAERLAGDGYDVVMLGRRRQRLDERASRIEREYGVRAEVLVAHLANPKDLELVEDRVSKEERLEILVNNAGFTPLQPFDKTDPDEIEAMVRVHVIALTRLSRAALPKMMERKRGTIVNVSSDGAFVSNPSPVMVTYAATKAYVNQFSRGLHALAHGSGVRVQALCPGFVESEILDRHGISFADWGIPESVVMSAVDQVNASLAGLELGEAICVPSLKDASLLEKMNQLGEEVRDQSSTSGSPATRYAEADFPARSR